MLSVYRSREARKEIQQIERELEAERLAPMNAIAEENSRLLARVMKVEQERELRRTRKKLLLEPSTDFECAAFVPDGSTADQITKKIEGAYANFLDGANLSKSDQGTLKLFLQANPTADLTRPETFGQAWSFLQSKLNPEPEAEQVQPAPEEVKKTELVFGSREREREEHLLYEKELVAELSPILHEAVKTIEQTSGLNFPEACIRELWERFSRRRQPLTVANIRAAAISLYGEQVGLSEDEQIAYDMQVKDESLLSDEFAIKYTGRVPRGSAGPSWKFRYARSK